MKICERAARQLRSKFDERTFHDAILGAGALPLDLLDERITRWIDAQVAMTKKQVRGERTRTNVRSTVQTARIGPLAPPTRI